MDYIKAFIGILLVICLISSINFKNVRKFVTEHVVIHEPVEPSSPLGLYVQDFKGRVKIVDVLDYTPAHNAGLEPGDRILKVNGCKISNIKEFFECMEDTNGQDPVKLLVYRVDSCSTFPVEIVPFGSSCK